MQNKHKYSWEINRKPPPVVNKSDLNKNDFIIMNRKNEIIKREPGYVIGVV